MSSDQKLGDSLTLYRLDIQSIQNVCVLRQTLTMLLNEMWESEYERDKEKQEELNEKSVIIQRRIVEIERGKKHDRK